MVGDLNDQRDKHADAKLAFCVHVGTSASEHIKTSRPGFMEGRVQSLVDALAEQDFEVVAAPVQLRATRSSTQQVPEEVAVRKIPAEEGDEDTYIDRFIDT